MQSAVSSILDANFLSLECTRRLASPAFALGASRRLEILQTLRGRFVSMALPALTETEAEQSWNEQVFARVLGYSSILRHGKVPFNLTYKNYRGGCFDDFAVGFFWGGTGIATDLPVVSGELKSPGADLDAKQSGKSYKGRTPVQQALETAKTGGCSWTIVSNLDELRLYETSSQRLVARVYLTRILTSRDLATFQSLFDRHALLGQLDRDGRHTAGALVTAMNLHSSHPRTPLDRRDNHFRFFLRSVPKTRLRLPLFRLEERFRGACQAAGRSALLSSAPSPIPIQFEDGWLFVRTADAKLSVSAEGTVEVNLVMPLQLNGSTKIVPFKTLLDALKLSVELVAAIPSNPNAVLCSADLRDVADCEMQAPSMLLGSATGSGRTARDELSTGDLSWEGGASVVAQNLIASLMCELAFHFRGQTGGIGLDCGKVQASI